MKLYSASHISSNIKDLLENEHHGTVHSVFNRVVNVVFGEQLITVTDESVGVVPSGIRVVKGNSNGFNDGLIHQGTKVVSDSEKLIFVEDDLEIGYQNAQPISSKQTLELISGDQNSNSSELILREMKKLGDELAPVEGLCPLWHYVDVILGNDEENSMDSSSLLPMASVGLRAATIMVKGLKTGDEDVFMEGVKKLVGLGAGLTPSGDDIITGISGAIALLSERENIEDKMYLINMIPGIARNATNRIAYNYIQGAVKGEITGLLAQYISILTSGPISQLENTSKSLFSIGGTSGAELALGAFLGVTIFGLS